jgi:hypothetical protein
MSNTQKYFLGSSGQRIPGTEQTIQIGNTGGVDARFNPMYEFYEYYWTGQIYDKNDIGMSGLISKMQFYNQNTGATQYTTNDLTIKLGHIPSITGGSNPGPAIFPSSNVPEDFSTIAGVTDLTTVFVGSVTRSAGVGWTAIPFDTDFDYDDTKDLIVNFQYRNGDFQRSTLSAEWSYDSRTYGSALEYAISSYPTSSGARSGYVPTTKITIFG